MSETPKVRRIPAYRKDPHLIKAGIYVRVSTARIEQLRSLSNQASAMARYIYSRESWILKDIYMEVGSAKTGSFRREFTRLVEDCKEHQIEVVVVKSLSRFGRDNVEVIESINKSSRQRWRYNIFYGRRHRCRCELSGMGTELALCYKPIRK